MNDQQNNLDWKKVELHLIVLIKKYVDGGSTGVCHFCDTILPLRNRYNNGERTEELYNEIMKQQ